MMYKEVVPLSNLHLALRQMTSLKRLRIFQCRQGLPVNTQSKSCPCLLVKSRFLIGLGLFFFHAGLHGRIALKFESALYPSGCTQDVTSYELYLDAETRVSPFEVISPQSVQVLRLSGDCNLPSTPRRTPALRHTTIFGVTGNYFDQHTLDECFPDSRLVSFSYALGHRLGFELRSRHLESLVRISGATLRKLVLLRCSRLSSTVIEASLRELQQLEYLALDLVTVDELRVNFVPSVPATVKVFKLQVTNAWYAIPRLEEERGLCDALEDLILHRVIPPVHVAIAFRTTLMDEGDRSSRWKDIASSRSLLLEIGPWANKEVGGL